MRLKKAGAVIDTASPIPQLLQLLFDDPSVELMHAALSPTSAY